jgi:hypothetical protein
MSTDSRRRLGAITALVLGLFLGLTLLPVPITGPVGRYIGHGLWQVLGAGALGIPLLGAGLALAGFDRLGSLDMKRSAVLIVGLSLLIPYLVGVLTHVGRADLDIDVAQRGLAARLVGVLPGFFAETIAGKVGVAGAVLFGFLALSALTLATFAWHPLQRLEKGTAGGERRREPGEKPEERSAGKSRSDSLFPPSSGAPGPEREKSPADRCQRCDCGHRRRIRSAANRPADRTLGSGYRRG